MGFAVCAIASTRAPGMPVARPPPKIRRRHGPRGVSGHSALRTEDRDAVQIAGSEAGRWNVRVLYRAAKYRRRLMTGETASAELRSNKGSAAPAPGFMIGISATSENERAGVVRILYRSGSPPVTGVRRYSSGICAPCAPSHCSNVCSPGASALARSTSRMLLHTDSKSR